MGSWQSKTLGPATAGVLMQSASKLIAVRASPPDSPTDCHDSWRSHTQLASTDIMASLKLLQPDPITELCARLSCRLPFDHATTVLPVNFSPLGSQHLAQLPPTAPAGEGSGHGRSSGGDSEGAERHVHFNENEEASHRVRNHFQGVCIRLPGIRLPPSHPKGRVC